MIKLDDIRDSFLLDSRIEFDAWVATNLDELTQLFYGLSNKELIDCDFEQLYLDFSSSDIFQEFVTAEKHTQPFDAFLSLMGICAERLALEGRYTVSELLSRYLPDGSLKYRLKAIYTSHNIDDYRKDYVNNFSTILTLLSQAENFEIENHTHQLVDFLIYYFEKAEKRLKDHFPSQYETLKGLYSSPDLHKEYYFLGHDEVQEFIAGEYSYSLMIEEIAGQVYYPSTVIEDLFRNRINREISSHPNGGGYDKPLGYTKSVIRGEILDYGKTDFDQPYQNLMAADKVLLYCYFNMKKHYFTSLAVFKKVWLSLEPIITKRWCRPAFIDLGCGPLTSGLAFANQFMESTGQPIDFTYFGIDISNAMLDRAKQFSTCALFSKSADFQFYNSWNDIGVNKLKDAAGRNNPFIVNASYLFASSRLDVSDLAAFTRLLTSQCRNVHFIFQNPDRADRNHQWEEFKSQVKYSEIGGNVEKVFYKTSRSSFNDPGSEDVKYEILTLQL